MKIDVTVAIYKVHVEGFRAAAASSTLISTPGCVTSDGKSDPICGKDAPIVLTGVGRRSVSIVVGL